MGATPRGLSGETVRGNIRGNIQIVSMKKGELSMALMMWALGPFSLWVVASGAHLSIACSAAGPGDIGGRLRGLKSKNGRQAARRKVEPLGAGVKGWLLVSMCQIASVSFRAMSIWAILAPRWRPRRRLLRW